MTYDGALVMPKNCMTMTEDEMTYVEGGGGPLVIPAMAIAGVVIAGVTASYQGGVVIAQYLVNYYGANKAALYYYAAQPIVFRITGTEAPAFNLGFKNQFYTMAKKKL
jgi:lactobin A/cerein 7B family class IIb bacteriocin